MRIRRYAARLLASTTTTTASSPTCLSQPPPSPSAASPPCSLATDDCAICELSLAKPEVAPDSGKQRADIASLVEEELNCKETVDLVRHTSVSEDLAKQEVAEADAALDESQPVHCNSEADILLVGDAADVGQSFEDDGRTVGGSVNSATGSPFGTSISSIQEVGQNGGFIKAPNCSCVSDIVARSVGKSGRTDILCYVRRKGKKMSEVEFKEDDSQVHDGLLKHHCEKNEAMDRAHPSDTVDDFIPRPCESLSSTARSAAVQNLAEKAEVVDNSAANKCKARKTYPFECDMDFCGMTFKTRAELSVHKRNICTVESCGKSFRLHKYLRRHQRVHSDERPFKCPWEGCSMTFKWLWAQTEHFRVHTGERPYICMFPGCGQTFKYVSDFSRHRKKFKHRRYNFA